MAMGASRSWRLNKVFKSVRLLRLIRLVRLVRVQRLFRAVKDRIASEDTLLMIRVALLFLCLVLCAHYVACYWYLVASIKWIVNIEDSGPDWIQAEALEEAALFRRYAKSLHWALAQSGAATLDLYPANELEHIFASAVSIFWILMLSWVFSSFVLWVFKLRDSHWDQEQQEAKIRAFMQENRISAAVCNQVLRFFRLNCKKLMGRMHEADISLFNDLPVQIRVELHKQVHMPLLLEHPMFKRFAANEMESVCHLAVAMEHFFAGHTIFSAGDDAEGMLMVAFGELTYYMQSGHRGHSITWGQWISEAALWVKWKHPGCLIATTSCELLQIDCQKFLSVMTEVERNGACIDRIRTYAGLFAERFGNVHNPSDFHDNEDATQEMVNEAWPLEETSPSARRITQYLTQHTFNAFDTLRSTTPFGSTLRSKFYTA